MAAFRSRVTACTPLGAKAAQLSPSAPISAQGHRRRRPGRAFASSYPPLRGPGAQADHARRPIYTVRDAVGDPTGRSAGHHARAMVQRLRLRTLVTLGSLAVATGALGRAFGLHDVRFIGSELALLASMFCISRYVLPLVERRDRGASAEEQVGGLLEGLAGWRVIHDASMGRGNVDHILIGPTGVFTVETKSHPGPVGVSGV